MAESRKKIDWEKVESAYRAGLLSLREMAAEFGCSESYIRKKAKDKGWERDLTQKIEQEVRTKIVRSEVRSESKVSEREIIEANAQSILTIRLKHRGDISRSQKMVLKLLDELEAETDNSEVFAELGEIMRREGDREMDKLNDLYHKVISLPQRIDGMKKLSDTLKTLVGLEREAWGIKDDEQEENAVISAITRKIIHAERG